MNGIKIKTFGSTRKLAVKWVIRLEYLYIDRSQDASTITVFLNRIYRDVPWDGRRQRRQISGASVLRYSRNPFWLIDWWRFRRSIWRHRSAWGDWGFPATGSWRKRGRRSSTGTTEISILCCNWSTCRGFRQRRRRIPIPEFSRRRHCRRVQIRRRRRNWPEDSESGKETPPAIGFRIQDYSRERYNTEGAFLWPPFWFLTVNFFWFQFLAESNDFEFRLILHWREKSKKGPN